MSVSTTNNRISYNGDGTSTSFSFPYPFYALTDLAVYTFVVSTGALALLAQGTDYTVSATPNGQGIYSGGGSVVLASAPAAGVSVVIIRIPPKLQTLSLTANGSIPPLALMAALDYLTLLVQRVEDECGRAIGLKDGAVVTFDPSIPTPLVGLALLGINSAGTGLQFFDSTTFTGPTGATGATGAKGDKGDTGATGAAGTNAVTLTIGTTTTGAAGSDASVSNSGTSTDPVLDFTIPRGDTGATGATGATGPAGADGAAATVSIAATTTLQPYEAAQVTNEGNTHNAALHFYIPKGEKGDKGDPGPQGLRGIQGPPGTFGLVPTQSFAENITALSGDYFMLGLNTDPAIVELSDISGADGRVMVVKRNDAQVDITGANGLGQLVEGVSSISLTTVGESVTLISFGGNWYVV